MFRFPFLTPGSVGRVLIDSSLWTSNLYRTDVTALAFGDSCNVGVWLLHLAGVSAVLAMVTFRFGMSAKQYLIGFVYPRPTLGMMCSFVEHQWSERPDERTAIVESDWLFGVLFHFDYLHAVHHLFPGLPWNRSGVSGATTESTSAPTTAVSSSAATARSRVAG